MLALKLQFRNSIRQVYGKILLIDNPSACASTLFHTNLFVHVIIKLAPLSHINGREVKYAEF